MFSRKEAVQYARNARTHLHSHQIPKGPSNTLRKKPRLNTLRIRFKKIKEASRLQLPSHPFITITCNNHISLHSQQKKKSSNKEKGNHSHSFQQLFMTSPQLHASGALLPNGLPTVKVSPAFGYTQFGTAEIVMLNPFSLLASPPFPSSLLADWLSPFKTPL